MPRSAWKLARVVEAEAKVNEHVWKALVRLAGGNVILCEGTSLVRLELDGEPANGQDGQQFRGGFRLHTLSSLRKMST